MKNVLTLNPAKSNKYAEEEIPSSYTYPKEYKRKDIVKQVEILCGYFPRLSPDITLRYIKEILPTIVLPERAEGWFAIPKVSAIAQKYFPEVTNPPEQYCEAVKLIHAKLSESREFHNFRKGEIVPFRLHQHVLTSNALKELERVQLGDILIIAAQYGMYHRGKSERRAREIFTANEFGLGAFQVGVMTLIHPERYVQRKELDTYCSGDEFRPDGEESFSRTPIFFSDDGCLNFVMGTVSARRSRFGSVSGFLL